jgi:hypothetical protein
VGVAAEPLELPFVHTDGPDGTVEADGRLVPVEHRPFEATVAALHAYFGERLEQGPAVAVAPLALANEQVLEVDAVATGKGGVVQETATRIVCLLYELTCGRRRPPG